MSQILRTQSTNDLINLSHIRPKLPDKKQKVKRRCQYLCWIIVLAITFLINLAWIAYINDRAQKLKQDYGEKVTELKIKLKDLQDSKKAIQIELSDIKNKHDQLISSQNQSILEQNLQSFIIDENKKMHNDLSQKLNIQISKQVQDRVNQNFKGLREFEKQMRDKYKNLNTFCNDKVNGSYQHPTLLDQNNSITCLDQSILIGKIKSPQIVKNSPTGIQKEFVSYLDFYKDQTYSCKKLVLKNISTIIEVDGLHDTKGINLDQIVLVMKKEVDQSIQNWGLETIGDNKLSDGTLGINKILQQEKPIRYTALNLIRSCFQDSVLQPYCYEQLILNLNAQQNYRLEAIWDLESLFQHSVADNTLYFEMNLYCKG